uniref:NADH dehydrogenase subunit 2 n=1 Tax=Megalechis thoracata TaxID=245781 RepID=UPI0030E362AE
MDPRITSVFLFSLGLGTMLTFISSHWMMAWMGLEVNTIAMMPLMAQQYHPRAIEATIKYFLVQVTAAIMLLFASMLNIWASGEWAIDCLSYQPSLVLMTMALALKLGLAPMHFWLPSVLQGLNLTTGLILSTWQKLAPFALFIQIAPSLNPLLLTALGLLSTLIGGWAGLNQTQLRKILAYSSIAHLGWMIIILQLAPHLTIISLVIYIIMTSATFSTFKFLNTTKINTLSQTWSKTPLIASFTALLLLSLGGLPPLTGFLPKWLILQELTKQFPLTATIIALSALLSLYFYLRLSHTMTLTVFPSTNNTTTHWRLKYTQDMTWLSVIMVMTMMMLPATRMIQTLAQ